MTRAVHQMVFVFCSVGRPFEAGPSQLGLGRAIRRRKPQWGTKTSSRDTHCKQIADIFSQQQRAAYLGIVLCFPSIVRPLIVHHRTGATDNIFFSGRSDFRPPKTSGATDDLRLLRCAPLASLAAFVGHAPLVRSPPSPTEEQSRRRKRMNTLDSNRSIGSVSLRLALSCACTIVLVRVCQPNSPNNKHEFRQQQQQRQSRHEDTNSKQS